MTAKKKPPECGRCHAPVIFAITAAGKHMPLDKQRDPSGTSRYAVTCGVDLILYVRTLAPGEEPRPGIEHRHMTHYATCTGEQGVLGEEEADGVPLGDAPRAGPLPPGRVTDG